MTEQEKLEKNVNDMNAEGGGTKEKWELLLLTSIANSLAIIADRMTDRSEKDGNVD
jgi:hypothetical protein